MESLFAKLRAAARDEESELAAMPATFVSPLSAAEREAIVTAIVESRPRDREGGVSRVPASPATRSVNQRRRRVWSLVLAPLAVAAGLILAFRPFSTTVGRPPLPTYDVLASGGLKEQRGAGTPQPESTGVTASLQRVAKETELIVVARPVTAVEGPVAVRAFLVSTAGVHEIDPRAQVAPSGAAQLHVRMSDYARDARGPMQLKIVVGNPATVRAATPADARHEGPADSAIRWLTVPLEVVAD